MWRAVGGTGEEQWVVHVKSSRVVHVKSRSVVGYWGFMSLQQLTSYQNRYRRALMGFYSAASLGTGKSGCQHSTMTRYLTQSHYPDTEWTIPCPILLMSRLGCDNYKFYKSLVGLDWELNSWPPHVRPAIYLFGHLDQYVWRAAGDSVKWREVSGNCVKSGSCVKSNSCVTSDSRVNRSWWVVVQWSGMWLLYIEWCYVGVPICLKGRSLCVKSYGFTFVYRSTCSMCVKIYCLMSVYRSAYIHTREV